MRVLGLALVLIPPACASFLGVRAEAVTIDWVAVGDPGNACDPQNEGCFGAVAYSYRISKYEVTNTQYAEFLNAVAATDTNALYDTNMGSTVLPNYGGIARSGSSGSFTYSPIAGRENMPANWVTFWDSLRFANWLHNGQPTGAQEDTTTEDGAYTLTPEGIAANSITRNAEATIFLPSEDEWYKAAYYDAFTTSHFDYPTGTDAQTLCSLPGAASNTANCLFVVNDVTPVGSYTGSAGPHGTFDQGGNVYEWNEFNVGFLPGRGIRGGSFQDSSDGLLAADRNFRDPIGGTASVGFRVASIPEPGTALLLSGVLTLLVWHRLGRSSRR